MEKKQNKANNFLAIMSHHKVKPYSLLNCLYHSNTQQINITILIIRIQKKIPNDSKLSLGY